MMYSFCRSRLSRPFLCAAAALQLLAAPAMAQEVRLVSTDGFIDFSGTLLSFEDGVYVIQSSMGRLTFPAEEVSCEGDACPEVNEVASAFGIVGSPAMLRYLVPDLLDSYSLDADTDIQRAEAPEGATGYQLLTFEGELVADVGLTEADTGAAAAQLAFSDAALAIVPSRLTAEQARALGSSADGLARRGFENRIAKDAMVVLVGADAGVTALRMTEVAAIFAGEITNWSEIGGPDMAISVFAPAESSDISAMLTRQVMDPLRKRIAGQVIRVENSENVADAIARFPNGIGVGALSRVQGGGIAIADACDRAVAPTEASVRTARYPLGFDYYFYASPAGVPVHARGLIDFARGPLGQELVSAAGFLDLTVDVLEADGVAYGARTEGAQPLSAVLTVAREGAALDPRDLEEIDRLAELIRAGRIEGNEVMFLGVAAPGEEDAARDGARTALRALFAAHSDIEEQLTVAFSIDAVDGEGPQAACIAGLDDAVRVEIWTRALPGSG